MRRRITQYTDLAEDRLDDQQVPRLHYPPLVVEQLIEESLLQSAVPEVGEYLSFDKLCRASGHAPKTISDLLEEIGIQPEPRRDKLGRVKHYFNPNSIVRIEKFTEAQILTDEEKMLTAIFAVGSLRAQIRACRKQLQTLSKFGDVALASQVHGLEDAIKHRQAELKKAQLKYYRTIRNR